MKRLLFSLLSFATLWSAIAAEMPKEASKLKATPEELELLGELYRMMNPADAANRTPQFYLDNAVRPAMKARAEMPWGKNVSERDFRHFVLPLRVNNEAIDTHRSIFYSELSPRIKDMSMADAILEINHWCHEKATYQPSDGRTHSPLQTVSSAIGRCGEESTFTVAALRSMGIPARQVYTPRWAHTDDNHAWVEAWADGKWYFLGACEPEPVLNLGWFNAPAARGMLMHARVPGSHYDGPEEVLARMNGNTDINVTSNYAPVDTLTVTVTDSSGRPVENADVTFRIYNYAEFYPLVSKLTDADGITSIISGLGDMIVWAIAPDGKSFGFAKAAIGTDRNITVALDRNSRSTLSFDLNLTPPRPNDATVNVTAEMRSANDARMAREDSIRNSYTSTFATKESSAELAAMLDMDSERLWRIMSKSRGNHATVKAFLIGIKPDLNEKAMMLLESLTDKDLTDVTLDVLIDHMSAETTAGSLFAQYVLSPRICNEELTPFRQQLLSHYSGSEAKSFKAEPEKWVRWVADNVDASLDWYPEQATMDPESVWKSRKTSPMSRNIFFVAGARSFGIPARIDPITMKTQWADGYGDWHDVTFDTPANQQATAPKGTLTLPLASGTKIEDPKYYSHFTVSKINNGRPQLLNYPDFIPLSESFADGEELDCGQYMIVTGQRMADGSVLAHVDILNMTPDGIVDSLLVRNDPSGIQVIGSFDSESKFMQNSENTPRSLLSATGRGYYVLGILKPNNEPSNHALRDIAAESAALEQWQRPIVLLYEDEDAASRNQAVDMPALPSTVITGTDIDSSIMRQLAEIPGINGAEAPVFIIADTFNRVVFVTQGYTIGLGRRIADIARRL